MLSQLFPQAALVTLALKFKGSSPDWHPPSSGGSGVDSPAPLNELEGSRGLMLVSSTSPAWRPALPPCVAQWVTSLLKSQGLWRTEGCPSPVQRPHEGQHGAS